ncbi:uncharacterized protein [Drosophila bipectinata]|uniref:uncharacterized protein n=1 Tax=Drosophila bipectinata TaxID=42026 RepID=UPI001C8A8E15|nr:uncharacterized protein LOC108122388 [Drosophila bipectinata]
MARRLRGTEFDFKKLCDSFVEICPDFGIMSGSQNLESLDFANRVIFELGPEIRQLKQSGKDKMWCLNFHGGGSVYVYTYTFQKPINGQPRLGGGKLYLTVKQAGLLAVKKICDVLPTHQNPRDKILLTPLARSVFDPKNIPKIADELSALVGRVVNRVEVVRAVICSCQSDGFHLEYSQTHIALVAVGVTAQEFAQRKYQRRRTIKQYGQHGKIFNLHLYRIYAKYSKMSDQIADEEPLPQSDPPIEPKPNSSSSVEAVLRSIVKSPDDMLSGGSIDMKFVPPPNQERRAQVEAMPTAMNIRLDGTNFQTMKNNLMPPKNHKTDPSFSVIPI